MGYKCTALGCKSGYRSQKNRNMGERITFHSYPLKDQSLCEKWIRANPRKDFVPSKHSRLCSLHFINSDFVEVHTDSNMKRMLKYSSEVLTKRYLRKDAVPSIFPIASGYMSKPRKPKSSTTPVTSVMDGVNRKSKQVKTEQDYLEADDDISCLTMEEIKDKLLARDDALDGFEIKMFEDRLLIYRLGVEDKLPRIKACISVMVDNSRSISLDGRVIDDIVFNDLVPEVFQTMSQVVDAMALIRSWCEVQCESSDRLTAVKCLKDELDLKEES